MVDRKEIFILNNKTLLADQSKREALFWRQTSDSAMRPQVIFCLD